MPPWALAPLAAVLDLVFRRLQPPVPQRKPEELKIIKKILEHADDLFVVDQSSGYHQLYGTVRQHLSVLRHDMYMRGPTGISAAVNRETEECREMRKLLIIALTDLIRLSDVVEAALTGQSAPDYKHKQMVDDIRWRADAFWTAGENKNARRTEGDLRLICRREAPNLDTSGIRPRRFPNLHDGNVRRLVDEGRAMALKLIADVHAACQGRMRQTGSAGERGDELDEKIATTQQLLDKVIELTSALVRTEVYYPRVESTNQREVVEKIEELKLYRVTKAEVLPDDKRVEADALLRKFYEKIGLLVQGGEMVWTEGEWHWYKNEFDDFFRKLPRRDLV